MSERNYFEDIYTQQNSNLNNICLDSFHEEQINRIYFNQMEEIQKEYEKLFKEEQLENDNLSNEQLIKLEDELDFILNNLNEETRTNTHTNKYKIAEDFIRKYE